MITRQLDAKGVMVRAGTLVVAIGLRRMRLLGSAKAGLQVRLTAIALDLRRSWRLLELLQA